MRTTSTLLIVVSTLLIFQSINLVIVKNNHKNQITKYDHFIKETYTNGWLHGYMARKESKSNFQKQLDLDSINFVNKYLKQ